MKHTKSTALLKKRTVLFPAGAVPSAISQWYVAADLYRPRKGSKIYDADK